MKKRNTPILINYFLISISLILVLNNCEIKENSRNNLIPLPQKIEFDDGKLLLNSINVISYDNPEIEKTAYFLSSLLTRYTSKNIGIEFKSKRNNCISLSINSKLDSLSYELNINDTNVKLCSGSLKTLALSFSTLIQLLDEDNGEYIFPYVHIVDRPFFEWRTLMVDLARRWHPISSLKEVIELMHFYKVDKLHLHLSDNESFVVLLDAFPKLVSMNENGTKRYYTKAELRELVEFANVRGITIIPEIDLPGHSGELWKKYPEKFGALDKNNLPVNLHTVNMLSDRCYESIQILLKEISEIFYTSDYIHIGGDEVWMKVIEKQSTYLDYCKKKGLNQALKGNSQELYSFFLCQIDSIVRTLNKKTILWEGFPDNGCGKAIIPNDIPVVSWNTTYNSPKNLNKYGYPLIYASWIPNYVCGAMNFAPEQVDCYKWRSNKWSHWNRDVADVEISDENKLLGSQMCVWEQQYNQLMPILFSRLPALSERWWNYNNSNDYEDFLCRYNETTKKIEKYLQPVRFDVEENNSLDLFFENNVNIKLSSSDSGKIKYSLLDSWDILDYDSLNYNHPINLIESKVVSAQLYDDKGNKIGYPSQLRFEKIDPVFKYKAYRAPSNKGWKTMPDFDTLQVARTGYFGRITNSRLQEIQRYLFYKVEKKGHVDTRPTNLWNPFALEMDGMIKIDKEGEYIFKIRNKDGEVSLNINGNLFKGSKSDFSEQTFSLFLNEGVYPIRINYFYRNIQNILNIQYKTPFDNEFMGIENLLQTLK